MAVVLVSLFVQLLGALTFLHLLLQIGDFLVEVVLGREHFLSLVQVVEDVGERDGLREGEVDRVVIVLESVRELQGVVVEDSTPSWPLGLDCAVRGHHRLGGDLLVRAGQAYVRKLLLIGLADRRSVVSLEGLFDPFFLVRVGAGSYDVFLAAGNAGLYVAAVGKGVPLLKITIEHPLSLRPDEDAHIVLAVLVATPAGDTWLREVHDLKGVLLSLDAALGSEVEPLLVASRIRIHLHEQVVGVLAQRVPLGLQEVAGLKDRVKEENAIGILPSQPLLPVFMCYQEFEEFPRKVFELP